MSLKIRHDNLLAPAGNAGVPKRFIAFHSEPKTLHHDGNRGLTYETLCTISAVYYVRKNGEYKLTAVYTGHDRAGWWTWIYSLCRDSEPITLVAFGLWTQLAWCDIWLQMDMGRLTLRNRVLPSDGNGSQPGKELKLWQGLIVDEDPPGILIVRHGECTLRFVDVRNWWTGASAATILAVSGLNRSETTMTAPLRRDDSNASLVADELATAFMNHLAEIERRDLGGFRLTAAAQSWAAYRHKFMEHPIVCHGDLGTLKLEREAYFGGLIQARFIGHVKGPVYVLDCQSFYPAIMATNDYPHVAEGELVTPTPQLVLTGPPDAVFASRVTINTRKAAYPLRRDGRVIYASGRFETCLCGTDLKMACRRGDVEKMGLTIAYRSQPLFRKWVDAVWAWRIEAEEKGDLVAVDLAKQLGRSLYGKFGQLTAGWIDRPDKRVTKAWGRWSEGYKAGEQGKSFRAVAGYVQEQITRRWYEHEYAVDLAGRPAWERPVRMETEGSMPIIAGCITADGRAFLEAMAKIAGPRNVYYVAVDSLHVNKVGFVRLQKAGLIGEKTLGLLKIKYVAEVAEYIGDNHYILDGLPVCAGMTVRKIVDDGEAYEVEEHDRAASIMQRMDNGNTVRRVLKKKAPETNVAGVISSDGWVSPPIV